MKDPGYSTGKRATQRLLGANIIAAAAVIATVGLFQKSPDEIIAYTAGPVNAGAIWLESNSWWVLLAATAWAGVAKVIRDWLNSSWAWALIQEIIDRIAKDAFKEIGGDIHYAFVLGKLLQRT